MTTPRILTLDIETSPGLADIWSLWKENVPLVRLREASYVICFAGKFHDEKKVHFHSEFHDGFEPMVNAAWNLLNEADVVVTWNGKGFDVPHLQREFVLQDMTPPAPFGQVDLMRAVKRQFRFMSNKLAHVSVELGFEGKHEVGFEVWRGCMNGDPKAWATMKKYNIQDVKLTEALYDRLLPWVPNHPHMGLLAARKGLSCQNCGSTHVERRGFAYTQLGRYQKFVCHDCGRWSRTARREDGVDLRGTA